MSHTPSPAAAEFIAECHKAFAFAPREHGFDGPILDVLTPGLAYVRYFKGPVGIECIYEDRDDDTTVNILRVPGALDPANYRRDATGAIVRERVTALLRQQGCDDVADFAKVDAKVGCLETQARMRSTLESMARMIQQHLPSVLDGRVDVLG